MKLCKFSAKHDSIISAKIPVSAHVFNHLFTETSFDAEDIELWTTGDESFETENYKGKVGKNETFRILLVPGLSSIEHVRIASKQNLRNRR